MKKLTILILLIPTILIGQGWQRVYGGGAGKSVQQTTDGGYFITGVTSSFGNGSSDVYLIKTDGNGDTLWTKTYGTVGYEVGYSGQQTSDGGYIITGMTSPSSYGNSNVYLIKTDSKGDALWTKSIGGSFDDYGSSVQQTTDGGFIITGAKEPFANTADEDVYLIKTDSNGDTLWTKTYGGERFDWGLSVQQTTDGGFIITGGTTENVHRDVYIIKTDSNGDTLWTKTYGGFFDDYGNSVQQTTDGGFIITGETASAYSDGYEDVYLIKTDSNGDTLWTKTYGGVYFDIGCSVQQTTDGGYFITGYTKSFGNGQNVYLIKTEGNGDILWTKTYGGENYDTGLSGQQTIDGGYIITGYKTLYDFGWQNNVYLIKTDKNGGLTFTTEIPFPNPNRKLIKTVDLLGREITKPEKNKPYIEIYNDRTTQKKMKIE